jgi:hypothetical protein
METGTKGREELCKKFFCGVFSNESEVTRYLAFPLRCKSWDCPECRSAKAEEYRKRMLRIDDGRRLWMYTLTYFHSCGAEDAWKNYNAAWNRLRTHARKKYGSFDYIRVLESHTNSPYPHLHIIADIELKPSWFGPAAVAAGFGYQLDSHEISGEGALNYIRKYLTKEWTNEQSWALRKKYRCRIISFSRGLLSPLPQKHGWSQLIVGTNFDTCLEHIRNDYEWTTGKKGLVSYEDIREDFAEITIVWHDRPEPPLFPTDFTDKWHPDDWVPK